MLHIFLYNIVLEQPGIRLFILIFYLLENNKRSKKAAGTCRNWQGPYSIGYRTLKGMSYFSPVTVILLLLLLLLLLLRLLMLLLLLILLLMMMMLILLLLLSLISFFFLVLLLL